MSQSVLRERSVRSRDRMTMRRVIVKQSYLRKLARVGASFKNPRRRWFVFGIMNGSDPYLEYYETEDSSFTGTPINMFFLDTCQRIIKNKSTRQKHNFTIVLRDRDVTLVAETKTLMDEWCAIMTRKLQALGIFVDDDEHEYVMNPVSKPLTQQQRLRFYANRPANEISCDRSQSAAVPCPEMPNDLELDLDPNAKQCETEEQEAYEATRSPTGVENSYTVPAAERAKLTVALNGLDSQQNGSNSIFMEDTSINHIEHRSPSPDDMDASPLWPVECSTPTPASWAMLNGSVPSTPSSPNYMNLPQFRPLSSEFLPPIVSNHEAEISLLTPKVLEASGMASHAADNVFGWNMPPPDADAPPLYMPHGALERGANRSLKHSQIEELLHEQGNSGGIQIVLKRKDCLYAIAFVDCFQGVWIAGWNQRARPVLYRAFHIGDQVISINGQVVENARLAMKLIKHSPESAQITFILQRVPHAKLLAMKRNYESEDLGIRRRDGTAEILGVDELGPACYAGLTVRTPTIAGDDLTNWWITEVNHRPLNLFFKDDEIEKRLNAVGLDISAVVHPMDFVQELKKKLKGFTNYKDFLIY